MADVLCDTSFLIHLATKRIHNIDSVDEEIGSLTFVVPGVVLAELERLKENPAKRQDILYTIQYAKKFKTMEIGDGFADTRILGYASQNKVAVATMDRELKRRAKGAGCTVISFSNDRIVLES